MKMRLCLQNRLSDLLKRLWRRWDCVYKTVWIIIWINMQRLWRRWGCTYKMDWIIFWIGYEEDEAVFTKQIEWSYEESVYKTDCIIIWTDTHRLWGRWGRLCLQNRVDNLSNRRAWAVKKMGPHLPDRLNDLLNRHTGSEGDEAAFTKHLIGCIYKTDYRNLLNRHTNTDSEERS